MYEAASWNEFKGEIREEMLNYTTSKLEFTHLELRVCTSSTWLLITECESVENSGKGYILGDVIMWSLLELHVHVIYGVEYLHKQATRNIFKLFRINKSSLDCIQKKL